MLEQIKPQLTTDPEASPFYAPFKKMPASIDGRRTRSGSSPPARRPCRPWRCRRSSASTSSSARSIYPPRATRWASTTRRAVSSTTATASATTPPSTTRIAARIHNIGLEEVKRIRARDGEDARGHQLPRHARPVPGFHAQRPALLLQDAGRADGGVREDRARHRAAVAETLRPPAEDDVRDPRDSRRPAPRRRPRRTTSRRRSMARGRAIST